MPPQTDPNQAATAQRLRPDVFISYSSADKKTADTICEYLEQAGLGCWIAPRNITPAHDYGAAIIEGISHSRVMVLVLSRTANESDQVKREVERAVNKKIRVIPFRIEDVPMSPSLEYYLSTAHWLDAYTLPLSKHLKYLEATARSIIDGTKPDLAKFETPAAVKPAIRRWWLIAAAALLLMAIVSVTTFFVVMPQRKLSYSLTVQKMSEGQPVGGEIESSGRELYGNGWKYRMNVTPAGSGSLYILNEGSVNFNVLFPTPANNNSQALINGNHTLHTGWYFFDENPGREKVWIIWSALPLGELDAIFKAAEQNKLEIHDATQIKTIRDLIASYGNSEPAADSSSKGLTVTGRGSVLVSLLTLDHNQY